MGRASRDKRDIYYRKAQEEGWRARSAFKLLQIDKECSIFEGVKRVVDLCAAPGRWGQVLSRKLYLPAKLAPDSRDDDLPLIVAIDPGPVAPLEGVIQVRGELTNVRTAEVIRKSDGGNAVKKQKIVIRLKESHCNPVQNAIMYIVVVSWSLDTVFDCAPDGKGRS
ncbi:putative tRNA (cytidine(32)/guanosine(34)-2'-O)-methyltransferase [Neltuma alba]|uniref:putative tRNA (cytidine(32)/guanosine(34)-2'-O)-methyltransferase n=1 Tax=Neltuma alba TaxID=207710 RepID=UPI0010A58A87|nr:putative tRNA (cytidine(32)/guanosine(34)-2'-O)-methyltransferase [Prosopis alba]